MKEIKISKKYLIFPVNTNCRCKKVNFFLNEKLVYPLNIKLDAYHPNFFAYVDVSRFMGMSLSLSIEPYVDVEIRSSDTMDLPNLYGEPMRPTVHFTTRNGWINDPNGLIYLNGVYHMFYQHNPCEPNWENMHWGHATSRDMLHWQEEDLALFPDESGTMYSGSAFLDEKNASGLSPDGSPIPLLFYTSTKPFVQNIAFSTDGLRTVKKYEGNPIVPRIIHGNRDPKVVYCEECNAYIMAIFLKGESNDTYALLRSKNLLDWTEIQRLQMPGENECPDLFRISDGNGSFKWVLMGARNRYIVGEFKHGKFLPCQPIMAMHYHSCDYAGQTFSNLPNGRIVRMTWSRLPLHTAPFAGQMGIPMELKLEKRDQIYFLSALPIPELHSLAEHVEERKDLTVTEEKQTVVLEDCATLVELTADYLNEGELTLKCFGIPLTFDFSKGICFGEKKKEICPISLFKDRFEMVLIVDRCSAELYLDGGRIFSCLSGADFLPDRNIPTLTLRATAPVTLTSLRVSSLKSIWNEP